MSDIQVEGAELTEPVPVKTVKPEQFPARGDRGWVKLGALVLLGFVLWTWTRPTHQSQADLLRSVRYADRQIGVLFVTRQAACGGQHDTWVSDFSPQGGHWGRQCLRSESVSRELKSKQRGTVDRCLRDLTRYNLKADRVVLPDGPKTDCLP